MGMAVAVVAVSLIVIGACRVHGGDQEDEDSATVVNMPGEGFIENATFVLQNFETIPAEAQEEWRDLSLDDVVSRGIPYSRYNRYYTRFFLKKGETVDIVMEGSVPIGSNLGMTTEGISVMLLPGSVPFEQSHAQGYLPSTESDTGGYFQRLSRIEGKWQIGWAISAIESDYYWLMLENYARQDAWCHLTVSEPIG